MVSGRAIDLGWVDWGSCELQKGAGCSRGAPSSFNGATVPFRWVPAAFRGAIDPGGSEYSGFRRGALQHLGAQVVFGGALEII